MVRAEVAELVDALGSGSSPGLRVGVRVSPSAPYIKHYSQFEKVAGFSILPVVHRISPFDLTKPVSCLTTSRFA